MQTLVLAQLNDGSLDLTFNGTGKVVTSTGTGADEFYVTTVQPDGKILAGGYSTSGSVKDAVIFRYKDDGSLDSTFGTNGKVIQTVGLVFAYVWDMAVLNDNKILVGIEYSDGTNLSGFGIMKLNSNGTPDLSFGNGGLVKQQYGNTVNTALAMKVQPDGKIVMGGHYRNNTPTPKANFLLVRFNSNGSIDSTFGINGFAANNLSQRVASVHDDNGCYDLAILPDGKILAVGDVRVSSVNQRLALVRFNSNGTIDSSFGTNGVGMVDLDGSVDFGWALKVLSSGKILASGFSNSGSSTMENLLVRFNSDGTIDNSFGNSGTVVTVVTTTGNDHGYAISTSALDKIYVAVLSDNSTSSDFTILAFTEDGSPDMAFGSAGKVTTDFSSGKDLSRYLTFAPDGKLVVCGSATVSGKVNFAIARYHVQGVIPVELISFGYTALENQIMLNWKTASETNNYGFEIERAAGPVIHDGQKKWESIGFVKGAGTTTLSTSYSFNDIKPLAGAAFYRLKQIDNDGKFEYSNVIEVNNEIPSEFSLLQNYPNPFNPSTNIGFKLPEKAFVSLKIFNLAGEEVRTIVQGELENGYHSYNFDAAGLPSGIYLYRLNAGEFAQVRKMNLLK